MDALNRSTRTAISLAAVLTLGGLAAADHGVTRLPVWVEPHEEAPVEPAAFAKPAKANGEADLAELLVRSMGPTSAPKPPPTLRLPPREPRPLVLPAERTVRQIEHAASEATTEHGLTRVLRRCDQAFGALGEDEDRRERVELVASWAYEARGRLRLASDQHDDATDDFRQAVRLAPRRLTARHALAISLAEGGQVDQALAEFSRVLITEPESAEARRNRAALHLARGDSLGAVADCDVALSAMPEDHGERAATLRLRGTALHAAGRLFDAASDYDAAIRLAPGEALTYALRGHVYAEKGHYELALEDYRSALQHNNRHAESYRAMAWLLATCPEKNLRDPATAVEAAWRARRLLGENDFLTLEASAAAHAANGDFDQAIRLQQKALIVAGETPAGESQARLNRYRAGHAYTAPRP